jgi:hypothetical protein
MSEREDMLDAVAAAVCAKPPGMSAAECFRLRGKANPLCRANRECRLEQKSCQQLAYVLRPLATGSFLDACLVICPRIN